MERTEKQSSIEVSRNAQGKYAFKVKIYFNEEERAYDEVVHEIDSTMTLLRSSFK